MNPTLEGVYDGTSTTIMFNEMAGRPDLWIRGVKYTAGTASIASCAPWGGTKKNKAVGGGCWGCVTNAIAANANGSTYNGLTLATKTTIKCCFMNCTNDHAQRRVQFPSWCLRLCILRRLGPFPEREHRHCRLLQPDHAQRSTAGYRLVVLIGGPRLQRCFGSFHMCRKAAGICGRSLSKDPVPSPPSARERQRGLM